jgi:hypothetical protein
MSNMEIREMAKKKCVKLWEVAHKLGVNDGNFSRKLRLELPTNEKQVIISIIHDLSKGR